MFFQHIAGSEESVVKKKSSFFLVFRIFIIPQGRESLDLIWDGEKGIKSILSQTSSLDFGLCIKQGRAVHNFNQHLMEPISFFCFFWANFDEIFCGS